MAESTMPRYLSADQAALLKDRIGRAVAGVRRELLDLGAESRGLDHEIGIALARAACRESLDPLEIAATTTIGRLEVLVAELGARLEQARIASSGTKANGHAPPPECECPPGHDAPIHWVGCPFAGCRRDASPRCEP